jgi:hypothetical protein
MEKILILKQMMTLENQNKIKNNGVLDDIDGMKGKKQKLNSKKRSHTKPKRIMTYH